MAVRANESRASGGGGVSVTVVGVRATMSLQRLGVSLLDQQLGREGTARGGPPVNGGRWASGEGWQVKPRD